MQVTCLHSTMMLSLTCYTRRSDLPRFTSLGRAGGVSWYSGTISEKDELVISLRLR
jgi:hypothetical protein